MTEETPRPKILTPRKVRNRVKKISELQNAKEAKRMRVRLMRAVIRAVATNAIKAPRKCARILQNGLSAKAA
ncbi:hypothetical protein ACIKTA_06015 [Hansschlegelia beijingensis]